MIETRHTNIHLIRRLFGAKWRGKYPPLWVWLDIGLVVAGLACLVAAYSIVAINDANATAASVERNRAIAAMRETARVEDSLIRLLNSETLIVDTDFVSCKLRDRASTRL